jgi:hypothetical protein
MSWAPIPGSGSSNADLPDLPGERGRYLLYLGRPIIDDGPRWVHFSWRGEAFVLRDFACGRMRKGDPKLTATDIWRSAKRRIQCSGEYFHPSTDVDWWTKTLKKLDAE